ncbi:MAG: hypothetical protein LBF26_00095 [Puniceicoccales bacterium]|jgi:transketolase|nr:hypothetical protein [Puniceicoccales bacterium]
MDCEQNCGACSGCNISGSCGELSPCDGEVLAQLADFGRGFSQKLLPNSPHGYASACLRAVLHGKFLRTIPNIPRWIDRDRFVVGRGKIPNLLPWAYLAGFPIQLDDIVENVKNISENFKFQSIGMEPAVESPITKAVDRAISHKKMTAALQQRGISCLSKVLGLTGSIPGRDLTVAESLQLAANAKLDNLILISEPDAMDDLPHTSTSELRAMGFSVEEIEKDDVQTVYGKLIHARINAQRQPQIILIRTQSTEDTEFSTAVIPDETITDENFFVPDTIHNHFALLNMRKNSDYENWQYRFECAVDLYPEILQFVEGLHAH